MTASKKDKARFAIRYQVFEGDDGWRWHARASNGRILASSEAFASKRNAVRAAEDFQGLAINRCTIVETP